MDKRFRKDKFIHSHLIFPPKSCKEVIAPGNFKKVIAEEEEERVEGENEEKIDNLVVHVIITAIMKRAVINFTDIKM